MSYTVKPVSEAELKEWQSSLMDPKRTLSERARALWGLRHAREPLAVELIGGFLEGVHEGSHPSANALLQHEAAYCLGQRGDASAVAILERLVRDTKHSIIVRHEAGEALAALVGSPGVDLDLIRKLLSDFKDCEFQEVAETCQLGLKRLEHVASGKKEGMETPYPETVDPSPAFKDNEYTDEKLRDILLSSEKSLFDRYRALFSLRNIIASKDSDKARVCKVSLLLAEGLNAPQSALLRHEVAFVLGQLGEPVTAEALSQCVANEKEHCMVRHEAAEALGTVLGNAEERKLDEQAAIAKKCLHKHLQDPNQIVRESCVLALDVADYVCSDKMEYVEMPKA